MLLNIWLLLLLCIVFRREIWRFYRHDLAPFVWQNSHPWLQVGLFASQFYARLAYGMLYRKWSNWNLCVTRAHEDQDVFFTIDFSPDGIRRHAITLKELKGLKSAKRIVDGVEFFDNLPRYELVTDFPTSKYTLIFA